MRDGTAALATARNTAPAGDGGRHYGSRWRTITAMALLTIGWALSGPAAAAAAETDGSADPAPAGSEAQTGAPAPDGQGEPEAAAAGSEAAADGSDEVFVPTEEISEDFAVSFPVDI